MVHYQRYHPLKKGLELVVVDEESQSSFVGLICGNSILYNKRTRPGLLSLLLSLISCSLIFAPQFLNFPPGFSLLYSFGYEDQSLLSEMNANTPLCSSIPNGTISCDRNSIRSDICIMKGDVRTDSLSSSIYLYTSTNANGFIDYVPDLTDGGEEDDEQELQHENIKPYPRKWEKSTMDTISELHLVSKRKTGSRRHCDVWHDVPAVFFSTGGYTSNIYHEFNDGIVPLYITSQHFNKRVVFVILDYHEWWFIKYGDILSILSDYPPIDFSGDNRTHCFPEAMAGLRIHDDLTVNPLLMEGGKTIKDFRDILDQAYWPRIKGLTEDGEREAKLNNLSSPSSSQESLEIRMELKKPKLVILLRQESRAITNEDLLVKMAEQIGFEVEVLRPVRTSELARIYWVLNSSDVTISVHGAVLTHFLFMKPRSVLIQVILLGTEWASETYFGEPSTKLGLKYIDYKILSRESSLFDEYDENDPVLTDPINVGKKGWEFTKKICLDHQNVRLNLVRFQKRLLQEYDYSFAKKN
ncbi:Alpha-1,3-arabinosyltransferase XAT3 [Camellia lanceoleosa]|uniref:Alpha-1,3-arabinosyltransferase XAT3 n=1 Tax=Camellia lanceoleosa TaxID=1840588 RepID=A0ACC0G7L5_9ERIC|nr:Alpha-1,3-arabinosyltransferase XAT3 [Camellia lanceoleosa]